MPELWAIKVDTLTSGYPVALSSQFAHETVLLRKHYVLSILTV